MSAIKHMVDELILARHGRTAMEELTEESYQRWDREFVFDALKQLRYGQSFCNYFGITDHILFYTRDMEKCRQLIRKHYL